MIELSVDQASSQKNTTCPVATIMFACYYNAVLNLYAFL